MKRFVPPVPLPVRYGLSSLALAFAYALSKGATWTTDFSLWITPELGGDL